MAGGDCGRGMMAEKIVTRMKDGERRSIHDGEADVRRQEMRSLQTAWVLADWAASGRIVELGCLDYHLDGASDVFTTTKPFDVLVEGLDFAKNQGDRI